MVTLHSHLVCMYRIQCEFEICKSGRHVTLTFDLLNDLGILIYMEASLFCIHIWYFLEKLFSLNNYSRHIHAAVKKMMPKILKAFLLQLRKMPLKAWFPWFWASFVLGHFDISCHGNAICLPYLFQTLYFVAVWKFWKRQT